MLGQRFEPYTAEIEPGSLVLAQADYDNRQKQKASTQIGTEPRIHVERSNMWP